MSENKNSVVAVKIIEAANDPIQKAEQPTALLGNKKDASEWISPIFPLSGLKEIVNHSTILPQCIRAYKDNIAGFGIAIKYRTDEKEDGAMKAEWDKAQRVLDLLSLDMATKQVFECIIEARETYGCAYLEVVRNIKGEVVEISFVKDTPSVQKTSPLFPLVDTVYYYNGEDVKRKKKFSKYKQEKNGQTVYFKEFGDPRIMDNHNGEYASTDEEGEPIPIENQANEILEFTIGTEDYGQVRWIGQTLNAIGSRRAENLNNNYFENGRHTPLAVIVSGGSLSDDSYRHLQEYINGIKGESGQHAFLLLEIEETENKTGIDPEKKPTVELKDMASILQKDELFQEYLDNSRRKIQSAFRLPDLYTGYTMEFNRATAQTAQEITEAQVFQPERGSLSWIINNKLLNEYRFKYVEVYCKKPDISNPDDQAKMLAITERAGGVTPNMAKEISYRTMGLKGEENYQGDWGDTPLALNKQAAMQNINSQLNGAIQKAMSNHDSDVVAVLKDVRVLLRRRMEGDNREGV